MTLSNVNEVEEIRLHDLESSEKFMVYHKPGDIYTKLRFDWHFPFVHRETRMYTDWLIADTGWLQGAYVLDVEELGQHGLVLHNDDVCVRAHWEVIYRSGRTQMYYFKSYESACETYTKFKDKHPQFFGVMPFSKSSTTFNND